MAQAKAAGLVRDKSGWKKYPASMLRARVVTETLRAIAPEIAQGTFTPEEIDDDDTQTAPAPPLRNVTEPDPDPAPAPKPTVERATPSQVERLNRYWKALKKPESDKKTAFEWAEKEFPSTSIAKAIAFRGLTKLQAAGLMKYLQDQMNEVAEAEEAALAKAEATA